MCFSGSTLDSNSLVQGSNPAAGAVDQGERRLGQRSGRGGSPPSRVGGGGAHCYTWRSTFVSYTACVQRISFAACVRMFSFAVKRMQNKREGPQSPVMWGRWRGALLQAGFEPAIYATTVDDGNHYATLPPISYGRSGAVTWCAPFVTCRQI